MDEKTRFLSAYCATGIHEYKAEYKETHKLHDTTLHAGDAAAYAIQFSPNQTPYRDTIFIKLLVGLSQDSSFSVNQGDYKPSTCMQAHHGVAWMQAAPYLFATHPTADAPKIPPSLSHLQSTPRSSISSACTLFISRSVHALRFHYAGTKQALKLLFDNTLDIFKNFSGNLRCTFICFIHPSQALLIPGGRSANKVPAWPFVVLGYGFGAFALLPFMALWRPDRDLKLPLPVKELVSGGVGCAVIRGPDMHSAHEKAADPLYRSLMMRTFRHAGGLGQARYQGGGDQDPSGCRPCRGNLPAI